MHTCWFLGPGREGSHFPAQPLFSMTEGSNESLTTVYTYYRVWGLLIEPPQHQLSSSQQRNTVCVYHKVAITQAMQQQYDIYAYTLLKIIAGSFSLV